jgi:RNA polymerase sigma factor (sigma-70 family)
MTKSNSKSLDGDAGVLFQSFAGELKRSCNSAYESLWSRFLSPLKSLAQQQVGKQLQAKFDADDVVQSVFLSFVAGLNAGRLRLDSSEELRGLLALMVTRKCARYVGRYSAGRRSVQRETGRWKEVAQNASLSAREPSPEEALALEEELTGLLAQFDDQDKEVVRALLDGQSTAQIAERLGCSRRTIQRTVRRVSEVLQPSLTSTISNR